MLSSRAGSEIRGNLTSRSGSAKESHFRHSSMAYLKRQSRSIPCVLQGPFRAHGSGRGSARGRLPGAVVCGPAPPRSADPSRRHRCLSRRPFPKSCELLRDPALLHKPFSSLSPHFISLLNVFYRPPPSLAPPSLVPSQIPGPGTAPMPT